jgi:Protein of unknown function (DUF4058)
MPMHDWELVEAGIYLAFHHWWISEISDALNQGLLPKSLYALPEQVAAGFGPDVLTLQGDSEPSDSEWGGTATLTRSKPKATFTARKIGGISPRRKSLVAVRHVTGDRVVAMIEIVSPGNKNTTHAFRSFILKAGELIDQRVHLLLIDPFPPGPRDPNGIHAAIWEDIAGEQFLLPSDKPLTLVAYEIESDINAFVETIAVGDTLPEMPLFLAPDMHILLPLEKTYLSAWKKVPPRWQRVIAPPSSDL